MTTEPESTIAKEIAQWRADIRLMASSPSNLVAMLCYGHNWATNPNKLRTNRESKACRTFARWCRKRLAGRIGWQESETTGSLIHAGPGHRG